MTDADQPYPQMSDLTAFLLGQIGYHSSSRFAELLAPVGISPRHFGMLRVLREHDGRSQQQLCETLGIHRNVMVGLVDELEKRGLVERRRHPSDRRAHAVYLLPAAHDVLARAQGVAEGLDGELLATFDDAERATLLGLLQRLAVANGLRRGIHPGLAGESAAPPCS
ncbi:MarR family winged helix-turn-helix transcriptional regulator [Nocardia arizonensis]|uniref:MarR family winged helix-turn-helix transcriptional regulator n=1 Tax=Nocardia arizonensis TaxID=1141647 RepID=UPI0009E9E40C|nr:MarR family winged helix-turn-helix transcriptional regulator [Nocardia arizonensis]